jgi:2-polyprenyl-3-methyl-5-hydroxy-6-metoxy-1,4-benzoquinol methylase
MDAGAYNFTTHNIRLDNGTHTLPSAGITIDQHPVTQSVRRLLRTIYPGGVSGKTIIDVGCLEGGYATEFARMGMISTGLEVRETNYKNCLLVKSQVNQPNLTFIHGDANDIARHGRRGDAVAQ